MAKRNYAKEIYELIERKYPNAWKQPKNNSYLQALYPSQDATLKLKEFTIEKIRICLLVGIACGLLGGLMWIKEAKLNDIVYIQRNGYGEGTKEEKLEVSHGNKTQNVTLELEEREYTVAEQEELYKDFSVDLKEKILGENKSLNDISYDLNLVKNIGDYPFNVDWTFDKEEYISKEGILQIEKLEKPKLIILSAHISGNGFTRIEEIPCLIKDRKIPFSFEYKLKRLLEQTEEKHRNEDRLTLPSEIEGEELRWRRKKENYGKLMVFGAPILMLILYYCKDRDLGKQVKERQEQLKEDYPTIVSKLALFLGAGLSIAKAWERVAKSDDTGRYAYEEMKITLHEIESGVPTSTAYESFGKRCHENCYTKLVSVLLQNRTKGSNNVSAMLRDEAANAFEQRKQEAIKLGEKVGTKMLVPMMLLLLVVLIIVMVPAFMNQIF